MPEPQERLLTGVRRLAALRPRFDLGYARRAAAGNFIASLCAPRRGWQFHCFALRAAPRLALRSYTTVAPTTTASTTTTATS